MCYLFQCWKSNEPNVVLNFGNLRNLPNQYESLLWGQKKNLWNFPIGWEGEGHLSWSCSIPLYYICSTTTIPNNISTRDSLGTRMIGKSGK